MLTFTFFPTNEAGYRIPVDWQSTDAIPIISFLLSSLAGAFSLAKFFVVGPVPLVPQTTLFGGLGSINFLAIFLLCLMCITRMVSLEAVFFFRYAAYDFSTSYHGPTSLIPPILPLQMRLAVYFFPAALTIAINFVALAKNGNLKKK